jgi:hypothetical protein
MLIFALSGDLTAVLADNLPADAQLHPRAAPAGWPNKIGLKDRSKLFSRNGATIVPDFDFDPYGWLSV